jgi:hypothetical protein
MRPPLDAYDVLIHLLPKQVPLLKQAVDPPLVVFSRGTEAGKAGTPGGAMPVIDYNPVALYLSELRVRLLLTLTSTCLHAHIQLLTFK